MNTATTGTPASLARLARRRLILGKLTAMASDIAGLEPFPIPHGAEPNGYAALFTAEPDLASRIAHRSRAAGIESDVLRYNYRPLYRTPVLARYAPAQPCRNTERLATTLLTVPCHECVATDEVDAARRPRRTRREPRRSPLREVTEETGLTARLLPGPGLGQPDGAG
ncbi:MAG: hypothetical protein ACRDRQ_19175, partial [Pseudonocardiaceae bacterium]